MRIDKLVQHTTSCHKKDLVVSMPRGIVEMIVKKEIPLVVGHSTGDVRPVYGCLHCKKGFTCHSKRVEGHSIASLMPSLYKEHEACRGEWAAYKHLYTDLPDSPVFLPHRLIRRDPGTKPASNEGPKAASETSATVGLSEECRKLLIDAKNFGDDADWIDEDEDAELTVEELCKLVFRKIKNNHTDSMRALQKEMEKSKKLQERNEKLVEELESAAPDTAKAVPSNVADLTDMLEEMKERNQELKEEVEALRIQLSAAQQSPAIPTLEINDEVETLRTELEELRSSYEILRSEAIDREAELEGEIEAMMVRGSVEPSLMDPLIKVFYIDSDNRAVEEPTVNDMVRGVIRLTKEALLQTEKDQIMLKQYGKRIQQLETLISRDFD
jgi:hypothetical protein